MQAALTTLVRLRCRKIARNGPAKPHIPGFRRPQIKQTGASALVSLPHDGQRIAPLVLRNIVARGVGGKAMTLIEPRAEVDQPAGQRTEGTLRICGPVDGGSTRRAPRL